MTSADSFTRACRARAPFRGLTSPGPLCVPAVALVLFAVPIAIAEAQGNGNPFAGTSVQQLKAIYLQCADASTNTVLPRDAMAACSLAAESLRERAFEAISSRCSPVSTEREAPGPWPRQRRGPVDSRTRPRRTAAAARKPGSGPRRPVPCPDRGDARIGLDALEQRRERRSGLRQVLAGAAPHRHGGGEDVERAEALAAATASPGTGRRRRPTARAGGRGHAGPSPCAPRRRAPGYQRSG